MTEEELQYLMGHEILNREFSHTDLLNADRLMIMYEKLNRRCVFPNENSDNINYTVKETPFFIDGVTNCTLKIDDGSSTNEHMEVDIWSAPNDRLGIKITSDKTVQVNADYRKVSHTEGHTVRIDSAYRKALSASVRRSVGHSAKKAK